MKSWNWKFVSIYNIGNIFGLWSRNVTKASMHTCTFVTSEKCQQVCKILANMIRCWTCTCSYIYLTFSLRFHCTGFYRPKALCFGLSVTVTEFVHVCIIIYWKFVITMSCKLLVKISPNLHSSAVGHVDEVILRSEGQRQGHSEMKYTLVRRTDWWFAVKAHPVLFAEIE